MNYHRALCCVGWLVAVSTSLAAQTSSLHSTQDSADVLVLDHDFSGSGELVRVFLQEGQVYRLELNSPNAALDIRGVVRTTHAPHVYPFLPSQTPSGSTLLEIYPQADAEYEIRSSRIGGDQLPTRLRLYRDVAASSRRQHVRSTHVWDIGLELAGGWHSGFAESSALSAADGDLDDGTDVEGCFAARATAGRFALCALGVAYQSQHGARSILWVYSEPRLRVIGHADRTGWELGPLVRVGIGMISASSATPVIIAPGAYLARNIAQGWTVQASYSRPFYKGFSQPVGTETTTPRSHRVTLGIGWYR